MTGFNTVAEFEKKIAEFFGAPYAVAVDSCTHGIELCLRLKGAKEIQVPFHTYLSIPMLANKLGVRLQFLDYKWARLYSVYDGVIDAAVYWRESGYRKVRRGDTMCISSGAMMCISFQYQKHLSLGRGGMILCHYAKERDILKKMSYDGREPGIPWRNQNIKTMGYHYYMTPETAELGLKKLPEAIATPPRLWTWEDYPDLTKMDVFK